jgi:hypothetical protein
MAVNEPCALKTRARAVWDCMTLFAELIVTKFLWTNNESVGRTFVVAPRPHSEGALHVTGNALMHAFAIPRGALPSDIRLMTGR